MRIIVKNGWAVHVNPSHTFPDSGLVYLDASAHLTPAEARRVAAALVKEAEKAEKKDKRRAK
jgi:hypothetical protein